MSTLLNNLSFRNSVRGYVKVSDGSIIILRAAIVDVRPSQVSSPFGVEFNVNYIVGISVHPSEGALNEVKDKPILEPGKQVNEGWIQLEINDKVSAYEEVIYKDAKIGEYLIRVEIEPIMVSKNTLFKVRQEPLYTLRWAPKISWNKNR
ncbi:MAG: hypothetical protein RXR08_09255 [Sulfolobaceae archaeon]